MLTHKRGREVGLSRHAVTSSNRFERVKARTRDILSMAEAFRLSHDRFQERIREDIYRSDDYGRLSAGDRQYIGGYIDRQIDVWYSVHVWVLHSAPCTAKMRASGEEVAYGGGYLFERNDWPYGTGEIGAGGVLVGRDNDALIVPWSAIDGGCHYWPLKDRDRVRWERGLMTDSEAWRPWGNPEKWSSD